MMRDPNTLASREAAFIRCLILRIAARLKWYRQQLVRQLICTRVRGVLCRRHISGLRPRTRSSSRRNINIGAPLFCVVCSCLQMQVCNSDVPPVRFPLNGMRFQFCQLEKSTPQICCSLHTGKSSNVACGCTPCAFSCKCPSVLQHGCASR